MKLRKNILIPFYLLLFSGVFYLFTALVGLLRIYQCIRLIDIIAPIVASLVGFSWEVPPDKVAIEPISLILFFIFFINTGLAIGLLKIPRIFRKIVLVRSSLGFIYGLFLAYVVIHEGYLVFMGAPLIWLSLHGTIIFFLTRKEITTSG